MNEEIFDSECYQDFTTASDWEIFIARIEEIINHWKTDDLRNESAGEVPNNSNLKIRTESLPFIDVSFELRYYKNADGDNADKTEPETETHPLNAPYDFGLYDESKISLDSCVSTWYGIKEYIVLRSVNTEITNESKIRILLSSINIVIANLHLDVPFFVQARENWQRLYFGVYEQNGIRTNFEMVHLQAGLHYCQYLSGLLDLYKSKIMAPYPIDNIILSMQATYILSDFAGCSWTQDLSNSQNDVFSFPFGVSIDPVNKLILKAWWRNFSDKSIIDNENFTNFEPTEAHLWTCLCEMTIDPVCYLNECLTELGQISNCQSTVADIMADFIEVSQNANPLELLTAPSVPTISTLLRKAAKNSVINNKKGHLPIPEDTLVPLLYFLFPDADEESNFPYNRLLIPDTVKEFYKDREDLFRGFKTCPADSLVWRLVIVLTYGLQSLGGIKAFAHIWYEFAQEMKFRWEKSIAISGIPSGFPDLKTCLLNQKLQMLNSCIERKKNREEMQVKYYSEMQSAEESDNSDNEFFDCSEEENVTPLGRLSKFGELKLLATGEPLYIPITQEPVLKTEDQLEEDTDILLKLGSNHESSELRARIMSASLLSDMESFKAANPGCIIEDFIRWYSPRDWIEEDTLDKFGQKNGHLSSRMTVEDNIWVQMWESARPVPANRQKRLFDDTREAEKILQYFDYVSISQIGELIYPVVTHIALYKILENLETITWEIPEEKNRVASLIRKGEDISRDTKFRMPKYDHFSEEVMEIELVISRIKSLLHKLQQNRKEDEETVKVVGSLISQKEVILEDKKEYPDLNLKGRLLSLFPGSPNLMVEEKLERDKKSSFPVPDQREFVLRTNVSRPLASSAKCPQFLRAILSRNEFRLIGAFSEDMVFF